MKLPRFLLKREWSYVIVGDENVYGVSMWTTSDIEEFETPIWKYYWNKLMRFVHR